MAISNRIQKIKNLVKKNSLDALLVSGEQDLLYGTGFSIAGAKALFFKNGDVVYFIDSMNTSLAKNKLKRASLSEIINGEPFANIVSCVKDSGAKKIGIDPAAISKRESDFFAGKMPKVKLVDGSEIISGLRSIKEKTEISAIKKAVRLTAAIDKKVRRKLKIGMTEKGIAVMVDVMIRSAGGENSFPTIAAIGPNSAFPHAVPTRRKMKEGDHLLLDFGMRYEGYCSDLTRIYYKGRINRQISAFLAIIRKARDVAIRSIKPGVKIASVVSRVNSIIIEAGFGQYLLHGLGHGVGLEVHEKPFLGTRSLGKFKKGMVVTVEPGIYKKGIGGIRLEDMVLVTGKGCEVLS